MSDALIQEAQAAQSNASNPALNVFVSANAGSGKTKVLVDRVIRLLLSGARPDAIVCITYTKAAAAEMRARLFAQLGSWTIADDAALAASVQALTGVSAPEDLGAARRLFARALETPGGLRIQTIHAFCERVLRRFPLEAGAPPGFEVMEEATATLLADEAMARVQLAAVDEPDGDLARAFGVLADQGVQALDKVQRLALSHRGSLNAALRDAGGLDGVIAHLAGRLGVDIGDTPDTLSQNAWADTDLAQARAAAQALASGSPTDQKKADAIFAALAAQDDTHTAMAAYRRAFFTKDGQGSRAKTIGTKSVRKAHAWLGPHLDREADRLLAFDAKIKGAKTLVLSRAAMCIASAFLADYARAKRLRSVLDFADLVEKTNQLLSSSEAAAWVLLKLDGGVDHVLVDEAQDTSPDQWTLVHALTAEFFAGEGQERPSQNFGQNHSQNDESSNQAGDTSTQQLVRTLFAVGDEKQSIYGFQGADPAQFLTAGQRLSAHAPDRYRGVDLPVSFRSAPAVLAAVDGVFAEPGVAGLLTPRGDLPRHQAQRSDCEGCVDLWPLIPQSPVQSTDDPWAVSAIAPEGKAVDERDAGSPDFQLARTIAQHIASAISRGERVSERDGRKWVHRPMRAGDVMILVRRRKAIFEHLIRELKAVGLPVAGADRMVLRDQTAVQDILCAARVALLPEDDLALAELLKSPFLHPVNQEDPVIDDMALFDLAHGREGRLWAALQESPDPRFAEARDFVRDLLGRVSVETPFALLSGLMDRASPTGESYGARLFARLGPDAEDPAREVLDRALAFGRSGSVGAGGAGGGGASALEHFVLACLGDEAAVKRESSDPRDEVRVMTVHGAKGLEAPIVILPDAGERAAAQFSRQDDSMRIDADGGLLWSPSKADDPPIAETLREAAQEAALAEDLRLLYVAMTRAQDRLIVCGGDGRSRGGPDSWHGRVAAGLRSLDAEMFVSPTDHSDLDPEAQASDTLTQGLRLGTAPDREPVGPSVGGTINAGALAAIDGAGNGVVNHAPPIPPHAIPHWARQNYVPPASRVAERTIAASTLLSDGADVDMVASPLREGGPDRFRRGNLIHMLLETLPDMPVDQRQTAGLNWLARQGVTPKEAQTLVAETLGVLNDPAFAPVFGPGSRAEAPIAGTAPELGTGAVLDGRVDRLAVTDDGVWIVDYKTNRPPPNDPARVDPAYIAQLAAYRAVLRQAYPGKPIRCALLWTFTTTLMQIPETLLDQILSPA